MRVRVTVAPDVAAELERLRRQEGLDVGDALNLLARRGMAAKAAARRPYVHRSHALGLRVGVSNLTDALEIIEID